MFRIPLKFYIEKSFLMFKPHLGNWILLILKVHPLIFYDFPLFLNKNIIKVPIYISEYKDIRSFVYHTTK